ncbi:MAG: hypothetical protein KC503_38355 [Myxococcales bacterium]|nr:hypothetical protein [Myxococcales bacterium]
MQRASSELLLAALLPRASILRCLEQAGGEAQAARALAAAQVAALRAIVDDDDAWQRLSAVVRRGRALDSWLAYDWPHGFEELLLCAPLCELVSFECARCTIGARQQGHSCAHPDSVFGRLAPLLAEADRQAVRAHISEVERMLDPAQERRWDLVAHRAIDGDGDDDDDDGKIGEAGP